MDTGDGSRDRSRDRGTVLMAPQRLGDGSLGSAISLFLRAYIGIVISLIYCNT